MLRIYKLVLTFVFCSALLSGQTLISKDSFFPARKRLPKNYKSEITDNKWEYMGTYRSDNGKTILPDSPQPALIVFEDGQNYRRIKGKKIVSGSKSDEQKIIFLDDTRLILEARDDKGRYRSLYHKRKPVKIKGDAENHGGKKQI